MKPRCFLELPAGLASVSLRLHGGRHCRPPISRMGNKAGYAEVILAALGLRSGEGASAYLWAESDPDVRALLRAYPDAAMLHRIADIIRGWADEEPRALWERLRAERKARGPMAEPDVAGWCWLQARSVLQKGPDAGYMPGGDEDGPGRWVPTQAGISAACSSLAAYATIVSSNRLINVAGPDLTNTGKGGTTFGGADFATPAADVAEAFERVAGFVVGGAWSFRLGEPDSGFGKAAYQREWRTHAGDVGNTPADTVEKIAARISIAGGWPPVAVLPTIPRAADVAAWLGTPGDLEGCVAYMDGPYEGTTGYLHELPRAEQVRIALDYHALGAVVCVSEAVPVNELTALGWHATDITGGRKGQRRTFARVATEALTMNREPQHRVARQESLFCTP